MAFRLALLASSLSPHSFAFSMFSPFKVLTTNPVEFLNVHQPSGTFRNDGVEEDEDDVDEAGGQAKVVPVLKIQSYEWQNRHTKPYYT